MEIFKKFAVFVTAALIVYTLVTGVFVAKANTEAVLYGTSHRSVSASELFEIFTKK